MPWRGEEDWLRRGKKETEPRPRSGVHMPLYMRAGTSCLGEKKLADACGETDTNIVNVKSFCVRPLVRSVQEICMR